MTRAERELVFVGPPAQNLGKANFGTLLKTWVEGAPTELTHLQAPAAPDDGASVAPAPVVLDVPNRAPPNQRVAPAGTNFRVTVTALAHADVGHDTADVTARVQEAKPSDEAPANDTPKQAFALADVDAPLPPSVQGELAHGVLSCIGELPQHDSEAHFVADLLGRFGYAKDDARLDHVRRNVIAFLRSALGRHIACLPASARRHEMPFQLVLPCNNYTATVHGQVDLAYWDESGLTIVDYKHARPGPSDDGYLRQLDAYAYALAELCQVEGDVKCYLVYLRGITPPVQHVVTQARRAALRERLDNLVGRWAGRSA